MARRTPEHRFQDLIEAATRVFIAQGYRGTQMEHVARALGVAKGTLYLYVESKEALFDAVTRYSASRDPIDPPASLPLKTPRPGATLRYVQKRITEEGALPLLTAALKRRRVHDVGAEFEGIVRELYAVMSRNRTGIRLIDCCAQDYPELAALWYTSGRQGALGLMLQYLESRRRRLRVFPDPAVTARIIIETVTFWAIHRHWDPAPQKVDEASVEESVVQFLSRALVKELQP